MMVSYLMFQILIVDSPLFMYDIAPDVGCMCQVILLFSLTKFGIISIINSSVAANDCKLNKNEHTKSIIRNMPGIWGQLLGPWYK
jgi:hypothetical protein